METDEQDHEVFNMDHDTEDNEPDMLRMNSQVTNNSYTQNVNPTYEKEMTRRTRV